MNQNPQDKIYYKVVTHNLQSCIINEKYLNTDNKKYCVTYKEGEFVYPILKNSKLMVFNTFNDASYFIRNKYEDNFIYSCHILKPNYNYNYNIAVFFTDDDFSIHWTNTHHYYSHKAPTGTVFCDAVKLFKKIEL